MSRSYRGNENYDAISAIVGAFVFVAALPFAGLFLLLNKKSRRR